MVSLIAASGHDINHPGNNNLYEINTYSVLSLFYNDRSVLENYHIYCLFDLINNNELNIFDIYSAAENKLIRKTIINNILATDMTTHKTEYDNLKEIVNKSKLLDKEDTLHNIIFEDKNNKIMFSSQLVHLADISNPTKKFGLYKKWVDLVFEEFFIQGDKERSQSLPISMLCDRNNTNIPASRIFFINFFIKDHLTLFLELSQGFKELLEQAESNIRRWEAIKNIK